MPKPDAPRPRVCYLLTVPVATSFLRGQLRYLRAAGYDITVVTSPGPELARFAEQEGVDHVAVPMAREVSPAADLLALWRLVRLFLRLRPRIVNAGTPKAGLLGMMAAALVLTPVRVYVLRGLRLETVGGLKRRVLWAAERLACLLAHRVVCISPSLQEAAIAERLTTARKSCVLGKGSSNGIDATRFTPASPQAAARARRRWGLPDGAFVFGAVGRITRDKGVADLVAAFAQLAEQHPDAWLLLAGKFERGDAVPDRCRQQIEEHPRIVATGFLASPEEAYAAIDLLVMPSLREGFGNVVGEAAAAGLPVVGRRVTGTVDAVADGETGLLVPPADVGALRRAMVYYLENPATARRHGRAGRRRVERDFAPRRVWDGLRSLYASLQAENGLTPPTPAAGPQDEPQHRAA